MKFSFLHMADLHLGYYQYNSDQRFNDFAKAAIWAAEEAVKRSVNFVLVAGDLFHKRSNLQPTTLAQAEYFFNLLKQAGIPCVMIEGNHDRPLYRDSGITWCQYLTQHKLVTLLNFVPSTSGKLDEARCDTPGSYVEVLEKVFVFGVGYKGSGLRTTLHEMTSPLRKVSQKGTYSVLALHAGLQGQLPEHIQDTLSPNDLEPFASSVDYVALGHFHKPFQLDDWIFNPGSLEVTGWDQYSPNRPGGVELVEVDTDRLPKHQVTHLASPVRPRIGEQFDVSNAESPLALGQQFESYMQNRWVKIHAAVAGKARPILRIVLTGQIRFDAFQLNLQELVDRAEGICRPLVCQIVLADRPSLSIGDPEAANESLSQIEHRILREMILQHPYYGKDPDTWLAAVQSTSELVLARAEPELVYTTLSSFNSNVLSVRKQTPDATA